eukprot:1157267-Pelagomonas_calceolata.AAC.7
MGSLLQDRIMLAVILGESLFVAPKVAKCWQESSAAEALVGAAYGQWLHINVALDDAVSARLWLRMCAYGCSCGCGCACMGMGKAEGVAVGEQVWMCVYECGCVCGCVRVRLHMGVVLAAYENWQVGARLWLDMAAYGKWQAMVTSDGDSVPKFDYQQVEKEARELREKVRKYVDR